MLDIDGTTQNLGRLDRRLPKLVSSAECYRLEDATSALFNLRLAGEIIAVALAERRGVEQVRGEDGKEFLIRLRDSGVIPPDIHSALDQVRLRGNRAVHGDEVHPSDVTASLAELERVDSWLGEQGGSLARELSGDYLNGPAQRLADRIRERGPAGPRTSAALAPRRTSPQPPASEPAPPRRAEGSSKGSSGGTIWVVGSVATLVLGVAVASALSGGGPQKTKLILPEEAASPGVAGNSEAVAFPDVPEAPAPAVPPRPIYTASFDCLRAGTETERMICGSETLAARDREMATHYVALLRAAPAASQQALRSNQAEWRRRRDNCERMDDPLACLERAYGARIGELSLWTSQMASLNTTDEPRSAARGEDAQPSIICVLPDGAQVQMTRDECRQRAGVIY